MSETRTRRPGNGRSFDGRRREGGYGAGNGRSRREGGERREFDKPRSDRPRRDFDRPGREDGERREFDRPRREFDRPRSDRPRRDFDRPRREDGERREFDRPRREFDRPRNDRPRRDFDRPRREDGERRSFDRPRREFDRPRNDRPRRDFDRPRREDGERRNFDRPRREFDRPRIERPRRDFEPREVFVEEAMPAEELMPTPLTDMFTEEVTQEEVVIETAATEEKAEPVAEKTEAQDEASETMLEGRNPVWEALKAGRAMEKLYISNTVEEETIQGILGIARREKVHIERVPRSRLDEMSETGHHQGVIAILPAMEYSTVETMIENVRNAGENALIVLLDEVQDPHNLGSVIRTCDCAGAHGVVILEHRSVGLTATVAKVSAGALSHVPVAKVTNLTRTIELLQQNGINVVGADAEGSPCYSVDMKGPTAIVIGNEGNGIRRMVREACDQLAGIPLKGHVDSLNASVAAAVLIFEAVRQRQSL